MSFETESDEGTIEIDFNGRTIKGECKAKDFKKQFEKVKQLMEGW